MSREYGFAENRFLETAKAMVSTLPQFTAHQGAVAGMYFGGRRLLLATGQTISDDLLDVYGFFMTAFALASSVYHTAQQDKPTLPQQVIFKLASIGSILGVFNIASFNPAFDKAVSKDETTQYTYLAIVIFLSVLAPALCTVQDVTEKESRILKAADFALGKVGAFIGAVFGLFATQSMLFKKEVQPMEANAFAAAIGTLLLVHFGAQYQSSTRVTSRLEAALQLVSPLGDFFSIINILSTTPSYADFIKKNKAAAYWQTWIAGCLAVLSTGYGLYRAFKMLSSHENGSEEQSVLTNRWLATSDTESMRTESIENTSNPLVQDDDSGSESSAGSESSVDTTAAFSIEMENPEIIITPPTPR
jgi:hypothetical protein